MDINTLEGFEFMEGDCKCHLAYGLAATINDTMEIHMGAKTAVHLSNQSSSAPNYNIVDGDVYIFSFLFKLV